MPLQRRVPKRGFKNPFRREYEVVNLGDLERITGDEIDKQVLAEAGLIHSEDGLVKLLGNGTIDRKVNVTVDAFSASAREAIEAAGGSCTALAEPVGPAPAKAVPAVKAEVETASEEVPAEEAAAEAEAEPAEDSTDAE
jgi:ribosomal protein L18E